MRLFVCTLVILQEDIPKALPVGLGLLQTGKGIMQDSNEINLMP